MELNAPPPWRCVDFISDLHLQASDAQTCEAWTQYLLNTTADAVFILGDLFEVWVGDDVISETSTFEARCVHVIRQAAQKTRIFIMQGNRDFLMGPALMHACNATLLDDPTVLVFGSQRWLLTHGDALCLADIPYQAFRNMVRSESWQKVFLAKTLPERQAIARDIREQSEAHKRNKSIGNESGYVDLDTAAVVQTLRAGHAKYMIHGHTHQPGLHLLDHGLERIVLSDWDAWAQPPRAEVLRIDIDSQGQSAARRITPATATKRQD